MALCPVPDCAEQGAYAKYEQSNSSIYQLDGRVPLSKAIPLGIQHVLAMFLGNVSPLLIICGSLQWRPA